MAGELQHGAGMPARAVLVRWRAGVQGGWHPGRAGACAGIPLGLLRYGTHARDLDGEHGVFWERAPSRR
jgi:hypothetical protein